MEESARKVPTLTKLGKLANAKKFEELEDLWTSAVAHPEYEPVHLLRVAAQVSRQGDPERAEGLVEVLVDHVTETRGAPQGLAAAREAAEQLPDCGVLRERLLKLYVEVHADYAELAELLETLYTADRDLERASALADAYVILRPGSFASEHSFLVPGKIEKILPGNGVLTVLFDNRHADYGPETVNKLHPLAEDHFAALVIYDPARLSELANEDAVAFVELAMRGDRDQQITYRDLKNHVTRLLGEKGWKSWWKGAREKLRRAPRIGMSGGSQPTLRHLRREDHFEDRLRRTFDREEDPCARLRQVLAYLAENRASDSEDEAELLVYLGNGAAKIAVTSLKEGRAAVALAALAVHAAVARSGAAVAHPSPRAAEQVLANLEDVGQLSQQLPEPLLVPTLEYVRETVPDRWAAVWAEAALRSGKRVCDVVVRGLLDAERTAELQMAVDRARARPTSSPDLVGWLWRTLNGSPLATRLTALEGLTTANLVFDLLELIDAVGKLAVVSGEERHQKVLESARTALVCQKSKPVTELVDGADRNYALRLKPVLERNSGLSPSVRTQLLGLLRGNYPDIFVEIERPWDEAEAIYTTENGLRRRQGELEHIMREEIPEVAKQIGEAAAFGDLSENAEFTAALEKRDQLTSRAAFIEAELLRAKIIPPDLATGDHVTIGTRVRTRDLTTDTEEVYTFLGPWDADSERLILNYRAPLALSFMGRKPGEEVEYGDDEDRRHWRVEAVESVLAPVASAPSSSEPVSPEPLSPEPLSPLPKTPADEQPAGESSAEESFAEDPPAEESPAEEPPADTGA